MGSGIAQVAAQNGVNGASARRLSRMLADESMAPTPVTLIDTSDDALDNGRSIILKSLTRISKKLHPEHESEQLSYVSDVFSRIATTMDAADGVADADCVIEAILENVSIKQTLFRRLDDLAPARTIFASNTSSLEIRALADHCSLERRSRFGGFHAFK